MSERLDNFDGQVSQQITGALERKPRVRVPVDFAVRVAARAAALPSPKPSTRASYGRTATALAAALLLLAMFCLAPWTQPSFASLGFDVQLLLLVQMLVISGWLIARRNV